MFIDERGDVPDRVSNNNKHDEVAGDARSTVNNENT